MNAWLLVAVLTILPFHPPPPLHAEHSGWPQWMGPRGDGASSATDVFPETGPIQLSESWRYPAGGSYSSISVVGKRAYTTGNGGNGEYLVALDVASGRELWRHQVTTTRKDMPLSTPAVGHGRVFTLNAAGLLHAVDGKSGKLLWSHDLATEFAALPPSHGIATSPLLVDDRLIVKVGGKEDHNLVAFEQSSGQVAWSVHHAKRASYSSPVVGELGGKRQVVVAASDRLFAVSPDDGSLLWAIDGLGFADRSPVLLPNDRLFLPLDKAGIMIQVSTGPDGKRLAAEEIWRAKHFKNSYSPAVYHEGSLYGFDERNLTCLDAATGAERWRHSMGLGSLILVDGHLIVLDTGSGSVSIVPASAEGFEERAIHWALEGTNGLDTPPSFASGHIFVRDQNEVVAVKIRRANPSPPPDADANSQ